MAGISLEWAQFGDFDSFDVLRSNSPMNVNSLPSPIATNLSTMYYVDTTVVAGATYYYRVVAWRDGVSKVSGEIGVQAKSNIYRYYRIYITANTGEFDGYSEMQEIELAVTAGGDDITTPSTPAKQSSYYGSRRATKLVDNEVLGSEAIWTSANETFPQWVSFDLGEQIRIAELRIYPTFEPWHKRAPKDFIVQGSNNGTKWENIKKFAGINDWESGTPKSFDLR
ncbi:discoidin domain-containing protein [Acinetobacter sp. SCLZS86]|uniref:discoidin domain-containing protein n=1 Tax=Acinetobacter sp. SCLZS86 TaxID=2908637 RepID=UPI001F365B1B|nr:discoidin domain-containing protein [Acinetobacter sp. SCLZS86]UIZ56289.1 discoidin domain-containing protein [Acinetobacter sp. SCLZS86]